MRNLMVRLARLLLLVAQILFYITTLVGVRLSVAVLSRFLRVPHTKLHRGPRQDALAVAVMVTLTWTALLALLLRLAAVPKDNWLLAPILSLPAALLIGLHVHRWATAQYFAALPGSLTLGYWKVPPFHIIQPYAIVPMERTKHLALFGPTGSGKSNNQKNFILNDIAKGAGVAVIDIKDGDLIDDILANIPPHRRTDVILVDIRDGAWPVGLNFFHGITAERRSVATNELVAILHRLFEDSWGARLEFLLTNLILALMEYPGATLLDISKILLDKDFAAEVASHVSNPGVKQFFDGFEQIFQKDKNSIAPLLNKTSKWVAFPELRNIIGQRTSSFNLRLVMDEGKILLVCIPQGAAGEGISQLLAAVIVALIQLAGHSRIDIPQAKRRPFFVYCDEFQFYANSSFSKILTESRSFRIGLTVASQYEEQLSPEIQLALANNVATSIECMGEPGPYQLSLTRLAEARRNPDLPPIILTPLPPVPPGDPAVAAEVRQLSRQRYGRRREDVEAEILSRFSAQPPQVQQKKPAGKVPRAQARVDIEEE